MKTEQWQDSALCKGKDVNEFYPEFGVKGTINKVNAIKAICRKCPVILQCLQYAMDNNEAYGIWGGLTPKERAKLRMRQRISTQETIVKVVKKNDNYEV